MTADNMWKLFEETGDIVFYILYKELCGDETIERSA